MAVVETNCCGRATTWWRWQSTKTKTANTLSNGPSNTCLPAAKPSSSFTSFGNQAILILLFLIFSLTSITRSMNHKPAIGNAGGGVDASAAIKQQYEKQTKDLFLTFHCFCTRKQVRNLPHFFLKFYLVFLNSNPFCYRYSASMSYSKIQTSQKCSRNTLITPR